jgi:hypothetical protein
MQGFGGVLQGHAGLVWSLQCLYRVYTAEVQRRDYLGYELLLVQFK